MPLSARTLTPLSDLLRPALWYMANVSGNVLKADESKPSVHSSIARTGRIIRDAKVWEHDWAYNSMIGKSLLKAFPSVALAVHWTALETRCCPQIAKHNFATVRAGYPLQITHSVGHERSGVTTSGEYSSFPRVILYIPPRQMFGLMAISYAGRVSYSLQSWRKMHVDRKLADVKAYFSDLVYSTRPTEVSNPVNQARPLSSGQVVCLIGLGCARRISYTMSRLLAQPINNEPSDYSSQDAGC